MTRILAVIAAALLLGGCAVGNTHNYGQSSLELGGVSSTGTVALCVQDVRSYVMSGNKPESFVGLRRGGFGNPFDVNTKSGGPLAAEIRDTISRSLAAKGVKVEPVTVPRTAGISEAKRALAQTRARRSMLVTLREWKSDTMMNTDLHYDVTAEVMDDKGAVLGTNSIRGVDNLGNLGMVSPEEGLVAMFATKFNALLGDEKIVAALR
jgi:hypothetical protein